MRALILFATCLPAFAAGTWVQGAACIQVAHGTATCSLPSLPQFGDLVTVGAVNENGGAGSADFDAIPITDNQSTIYICYRLSGYPTNAATCYAPAGASSGTWTITGHASSGSYPTLGKISFYISVYRGTNATIDAVASNNQTTTGGCTAFTTSNAKDLIVSYNYQSSASNTLVGANAGFTSRYVNGGAGYSTLNVVSLQDQFTTTTQSGINAQMTCTPNYNCPAGGTAINITQCLAFTIGAPYRIVHKSISGGF